MRQANKIIVLLVVTLATLWSMPPRMRALTRNQAALVIRHGENDVQTACVDFDEPQISGYELLQRSGLDLQISVRGLGSLICSIDGTGCPANDCLCQCKGGGDCIYWSYWHRFDGSWQYSQGGAAAYMVDPGVVEGWSWGPGAVNQAVPPPEISFEEVCQSAPTNTPTSSPTATNTRPAIVITPQATAARDTSLPTTAAQQPNNTPTSAPAVEPTATEENSFTPTPLPPQPGTAAATSESQISPQETVSPVATEVEQLPQIVAQEEPQISEIPASTAAPTVSPTVTATPGLVAVAQRAKADAKESPPEQIVQIVDEPAAEPQAPLAVIGAGIVPAVGAELGESNLASEDSSSIIGSDFLSYLVFIFIVAGLAGLLLFVTLRRKQRMQALK